jgi:hypothetical protein
MFLLHHVYLKHFCHLFSWNVDPQGKLKGILLRSQDKPHQNDSVIEHIFASKNKIYIGYFTYRLAGHLTICL